MEILILFAVSEKVICAFISSRLDCGLSRGNINILQLIQDTAPRLITLAKGSDRIT